jgi:hypothetical protein
MDRVRLAVAAAVLFMGLGACSTLAVAQVAAPLPTEAQRRECERNGGYWNTAANYCRVGG